MVRPSLPTHAINERRQEDYFITDSRNGPLSHPHQQVPQMPHFEAQRIKSALFGHRLPSHKSCPFVEGPYNPSRRGPCWLSSTVVLVRSKWKTFVWEGESWEDTAGCDIVKKVTSNRWRLELATEDVECGPTRGIRAPPTRFPKMMLERSRLDLWNFLFCVICA